MTNAYSATKVELTNGTGNPRRYTVAEGTGILKGKLLTLSDPRTAAEVSDSTTVGAGYAFAGIAAIEKVANDGSTSITAWTNGIFEICASGAIAVGRKVKSVGNGQVASALDTEAASGSIVGTCLETAADLEVVNIAVGQLF
jgi:hypothetical protein